MVGKTETQREKFVAGVQRQVALAKDPSYTYTNARGATVKPVKWWVENGEKLLIHPRYGISRLKGVTLLSCTPTTLVSTLNKLLTKAKAGGYDAAIGMPASEKSAPPKKTAPKVAKPKATAPKAEATPEEAKKVPKPKKEKKPKKDKKAKKSKKNKKGKKDKKSKKKSKKK